MSSAAHISPEKLRKLHKYLAWLRPQPVWLGKPRPRRPDRPDITPAFQKGLQRALRSLRRSVARDSDIVANRKLAAVDKRKRRQTRNQVHVARGGLHWQESSWLADAS